VATTEPYTAVDDDEIRAAMMADALDSAHLELGLIGPVTAQPVGIVDAGVHHSVAAQPLAVDGDGPVELAVCVHALQRRR
jgi:hypothetical protein